MTTQSSEPRSQWLAALKGSVPVCAGYVPLGTVFGFLFVQAGGFWLLAPVSSMLIYGGAVQYMMVPMLAAGLSVTTIALATLVVNLRHVFYGLSLLHRVPEGGWRRWFIAFALTDETYSQLTTLPEKTSVSYMVWLAFFNWCWWILGSLLGAVAGAALQTDLKGLDFVLTSLFAMLMCEQWRASKSALPLICALVCYGLARWASPDNALGLAIAFCAVACLLLGLRRKREA